MKKNIVSMALRECENAYRASRFPLLPSNPLAYSHRSMYLEPAAFKARVRYHWKKGLAEPGDCEGDSPMLMGIAIATAVVGIRPGWIPEVQKMGAELAPLFKKLFEKGNQ